MEILDEIRATTEKHALVFSEREATKLVDEPLKRLKAAPDETRIAFVFEALRQLPEGRSFALQLALKGMVASLLRAGIPLSGPDAVRLVQFVSVPRQTFPYKAILTAIEKAPQTPALHDALRHLRPKIDEWHGGPEMRDLHARIDALVEGVREQPVAAVGPWSRQVFGEISGSGRQADWLAVFQHARSLTQSTPSRKWETEAVALAEKIGRAEFLGAARPWLALGPTPNVTDQQTPEAEAAYQKGLVWFLGALRDASAAPQIADFAFACFRKIPQIGAVSHRVGNACVSVLAVFPGLDAVAQLSRLAARVKYEVARRLIEDALEEAAARNDVGRDDLEAMAVPRFGLDTQGARVETVGDCVARLAISGEGADLTWLRDGTPLKSLPASVKAANPAAVAELKRSARDIDTALSTLRIRLERQLLSPRWRLLASWQAWYLDHPVLSHFARRLVWEIEQDGAVQTAFVLEDRLTDWAGHPIAAAPDARVRLWHPIRSDVQTVLSWRCWLEDRGIRQPFKQAHREVYLLTDAERSTGTYSNRFAAHIVRQHQFAALCKERGWRFTLMGPWDSHNTPSLDLPQHNLRAEFAVEFPRDEETSGHAIYLTIGTGPVRFVPLDGSTHPVRLEEVPAAVFSEVMRDADLFVGVTSIGSDPAWGLEHPDDPRTSYWRSYAYGELTTASENRRDVIASLLPKLAIRDRCRIDGRFLVVRGDLHHYRIHLGSGNVLIEPGSRYLCIVQGSGDTAATVHLPFDGDRILSLILSKAFLLAEDSRIRDETIRRQITA
ncbi:MAG: DUF4132 domain-containing protein [Bryobacterales bacterium]|nr:DUF4132 domain-containing protein [Bryobacterales bacterium]